LYGLLTWFTGWRRNGDVEVGDFAEVGEGWLDLGLVAYDDDA
jgi:hypothetical protein